MIVYKIENLVNGKVYIGQTIQKNPKARWYEHTSRVKNGSRHPLYDSIRKYGLDNFSWEVIDKAESLESLNALEQHYVEKYNSINNGYNIREAGNNKTHNQKSILKMKQAQIDAHAKRRAEGREGGWTRVDGGCMKGKVHPKKGKPSTKWSEEAKAKHKIRCKEREEKKRLLKQGVV